jgi:osmoprotectant transport system ATP-binding protein
VITFEGVTKRYPDGTVAVDSLDLEIPGGKIAVLVGPSGCGKTTSLRMINRLVEPTSGRILLDGRDVQDANPSVLRRGIGYVIQQTGLFPHRTIEDNIATVPMLTGTDKRKARERARDLMQLVGLDAATMARRYPHQLSGGQQQRVGVARALAADPNIVLMDEPFGALDPPTREALQGEIRRIQAETQKTIVFVTHDMDEALRLGDRVAVMQSGKLVQFATPAEILAKPANEFVRQFVGGADMSIRVLAVALVAERMRRDGGAEGEPIRERASLKEALTLMMTSGREILPVIDDKGARVGIIRLTDLAHL